MKRHRALFHKLTKRGPDAFAALLQLCEREFPSAVRFLDNEVSLRKGSTAAKPIAIGIRPLTPSPASVPHAISHRLPYHITSDRTRPAGQPSLAEFTEELPPATAFSSVRHSTAFHGNQANDISCYPMRSRNRGVALLVNIIHFQSRPGEPRNGAEVDKVNLVQLFRQMGFTVMYYEDLTAVVSCFFLSLHNKYPINVQFDQKIYIVDSYARGCATCSTSCATRAGCAALTALSWR